MLKPNIERDYSAPHLMDGHARAFATSITTRESLLLFILAFRRPVTRNMAHDDASEVHTACRGAFDSIAAIPAFKRH
jgi:hypothetical protein